jgi:pimeloyl-ACP methyl ester carboxylesterase
LTSSVRSWRRAQNCLPASGRYDELKRIVQPTLVVHGHRDIMLPLMNAFVLSQHIPNAQLIIYPKSGHEALFQHSTLFVQHTRMFLNA